MKFGYIVCLLTVIFLISVPTFAADLPEKSLSLTDHKPTSSSFSKKIFNSEDVDQDTKVTPANPGDTWVFGISIVAI